MNKEQIEFYKTKPYFTNVMREMCSYVGVKFEKIQPRNDGWMTKHSWSTEDEAEFVEWMTNYLYQTVGARKELYGRTRMSKKECNRCARYFVFNYGWRIK